MCVELFSEFLLKTPGLTHMYLTYTINREKSKSVFYFLKYSRETGFSFSYEEVGELIRLIWASNEIDRVSNNGNSLSFGAKQYALEFLKIYLQKIQNEFFFNDF